MELDNHILRTLDATPKGSRPVTIGDLAREFGVSTALVRPVAQRLVDDGRATAVIVDVRGVPTLHGLVRLKAKADS